MTRSMLARTRSATSLAQAMLFMSPLSAAPAAPPVIPVYSYLVLRRPEAGSWAVWWPSPAGRPDAGGHGQGRRSEHELVDAVLGAVRGQLLQVPQLAHGYAQVGDQTEV